MRVKRAISGVTVFALLSLGGACGEEESPTVWQRAGQHVDSSVMQSYQAEDHCGWEEVTFLSVAWPLGTSGLHGKSRRYVRDPDHVVAKQALARFEPNARLPEDADFTGYSSDVGELWLDPGDQDTVAYVVMKDGKRVEAWPRTSLMGCD